MKAKIIYNGKEKEIEATYEIKKLFGMNGTKRSDFEKGDKYYSDSNGSIDWYRWDADDTDSARLLRRNAFHTEEDAIFKSEKDFLIAELETFAEENNDEINWGDMKEKYYICYNYYDKELSVSYIDVVRDMLQIYFSSEEIAQKAIDKFGDRIKKYLFNL